MLEPGFVLTLCGCVGLEAQILPPEIADPTLPCHPRESTGLVGRLELLSRLHQEFSLLAPVLGWKTHARDSPGL